MVLTSVRDRVLASPDRRPFRTCCRSWRECSSAWTHVHSSPTTAIYVPGGHDVDHARKRRSVLDAVSSDRTLTAADLVFYGRGADSVAESSA